MRKNIFLAVVVFCIFSVTLTFSVRTTLSKGLTAYSFAVLAGDGSSAHGNLDVRDQSVSDAGAIETINESRYSGNGGSYVMQLEFSLDGNTGDTSSLQDIAKSYSASDSRVTHMKFRNFAEADSVLPNADEENTLDASMAGGGSSGTLYDANATTGTYTIGPVVGLGFAFEGFGNAAAAGKGYQFSFVGPSEHEGSINPGGWDSSNVNLNEITSVDFKHRIFGGPTNYGFMELESVIGPE